MSIAEPRARELLEAIRGSMDADGGNTLGLVLAELLTKWDKEDAAQEGPE